MILKKVCDFLWYSNIYRFIYIINLFKGMNLDLKKYIDLAKGDHMQKLGMKLMKIYPELNLDFINFEYV
jgi:hypothetical protein